jgi:uncharacterized membrane protein (UPF0127 family)
MKRRYVLALLGAFVARAALPAQEPEPTGPQPELPKEKITIVTRDGQKHVFNVEMASSYAQQLTGLMFRKSVPEDGGMLFDWHQPRVSGMWMKNTLVPLDMIFINQDGTINTIAEDTVPESLTPIYSQGPVRATLEVAAGTTKRLNIRVGDKVEASIFKSAS